MAYLKIIGGPDLGQTQQLQPPCCVLGRHPDCHVAVEHPETSRHHAKIVPVQNEYFLEDLHSTNGTYLNHERVRGKRQIKDGDQIRISDTVFEFHEQGPGESTEGRGSESGGAVPVIVDDQKNAAEMVLASQQHSDTSTSRSHLALQAQLTAILEITKSLRQALALDKVLPQILESLFVVFPAVERGFVMLQGDDGSITPRWMKLRHEDPGQQIAISRTIVDRVMQSQEAVLSADVADDSRFRNSDSLGAAPIRSIMCAPLINSEGISFGVLQIDTVSRCGRFKEKDLAVLLGIATQASIAIDNARLHEKALQQRAIERDLELADQIQRSLLPVEPPQVPGYEFFHYYQPASHVGGDFFDYVFRADDRVAVVVADVAGHGFAAALLTAKLAADIRYRLLSTLPPAEAIGQLNTALARELLEDRFVTLLLAELTPATGELTIVNAGHVPPILRLPDGRLSELGREQSSLPLGIRDGLCYAQSSMWIPPGGLLVICTDGIQEAVNAAGQQYGGHRVRQHVAAAPGDPRQLVENMIDDVRHFITGCAQADDMCLVCIKRN